MRTLLASGLLAGLGACASTSDRTAQAYDACDRQVGLCYDSCAAEEDAEVREACRARCSAEVNACFASVSQGVAREARWVGVPSVAVFYGRYGSWSPYQGWHYGPHGRRYSYDPYGWRPGLHGYGRGRLAWGRYGLGFGPRLGGHAYHGRPYGVVLGIPGGALRHGDDRGLGQGEDPVVTTREVVRGPGGGVFAADGTRLRYGGKPGVTGGRPGVARPAYYPKLSAPTVRAPTVTAPTIGAAPTTSRPAVTRPAVRPIRPARQRATSRAASPRTAAPVSPRRGGSMVKPQRR